MQAAVFLVVVVTLFVTTARVIPNDVMKNAQDNAKTSTPQRDVITEKPDVIQEDTASSYSRRGIGDGSESYAAYSRDTVKDDVTFPAAGSLVFRDYVENNAASRDKLVSRDNVETDAASSSRDNVETDAASSRDNVENDAASSRDNVKNDAASSRDNVENDAASSRDNVKNDGASSRDNVENDAASSRDNVENDAASSSRDNVKNDAASSRDNVKNDAASSRDNVENDAASSRDNVENDAASSSRDNVENDAALPFFSSSYSKDLAEDGGASSLPSIVAHHDPIRAQHSNDSTTGRSPPYRAVAASASARTEPLDNGTSVGDNGQGGVRLQGLVIPLVSLAVFAGFAVVTWLAISYSCRMHRKDARNGVPVITYHWDFVEDVNVGSRL